jgi:serine/threonine-protein kinase
MRLGRYVLYSELASGGMARVHLARAFAPGGFSKTVAIKRLHPHLARDPSFVTMFLDEARLAARISHPNVVSTDDVVADQGELFLVMEYVQGQTLARLMRAAEQKGEPVPWRVACAICVGMLSGLHAAHEARSNSGVPLDIVHRDVSPQNVMVGEDGVARVLDFGVAKAAQRLFESTNSGAVKGKFAYMSPEQLAGKDVDRRCDVFAAGIVAWEVFAGGRLFDAASNAAMVGQILDKKIPPPSERRAELPPDIDRIVLKALARDPRDRWATAEEMAIAFESVGMATPREVASWVRGLAAEALARLADLVAEIESGADRIPASAGAGAADESTGTAIVMGERTRLEQQATELAPPPPIVAKRKRARIAIGGIALAVAIAIGVAGVAASGKHQEAAPVASATASSSAAAIEPSASVAIAPSAATAPPVASSAEGPKPRPARARTPPPRPSSAPRVPGLEKEM